MGGIAREVARLAGIGPEVEPLLGIPAGGIGDVGETGGAHEQAVRARFAGHQAAVIHLAHDPGTLVAGCRRWQRPRPHAAARQVRRRGVIRLRDKCEA
jgi:hypothetical protein